MHYTAILLVRLLLILTKMRKTAPAATAVEYQSVKFNVTTEDNPFVGAGPEVDRAWREISYDGKQHHSANSDWNETIERLGRLWDLTFDTSWRSNDFRGWAPKAWYAKVVIKSHTSNIGRGRIPGGYRGLPSASLHQPLTKGDLQRVLRASRRGVRKGSRCPADAYRYVMFINVIAHYSVYKFANKAMSLRPLLRDS